MLVQVENLVVGAPCGVMDQMAASLGRTASLMALTCQPAEVLASLHTQAEGRAKLEVCRTCVAVGQDVILTEQDVLQLHEPVEIPPDIALYGAQLLAG